MMRRILLPLVCFGAATLLGGCPQHVNAIIDEALPPEGYKPVYLTSSVGYADLLKEKGIALGEGVGASGAAIEDMIEGAVAPRPSDTARATVGGGSGATDGRGSGARGGSAPAATGVGAPAAATAPGVLAMEIRNVDDRRYPDLVELRAYVHDGTGRFVMGLAPPHFAGRGHWRDYWTTLVDSCGGQAVTIDSFEVTEVREDRREPLAIAYALDHSGSMGQVRTRKLRDAIQRTMRLIRRGDRVSVLTFTSTPIVEIALTGDSGVFRRFRGDDLSTYGGGTALYDGAEAAIAQLATAPTTHRRSLIVFSDGGDNDSDSTLAAVHRAAQKARVTIYTIAYGQAEETPLRDLAMYTGGKFYRIYSTQEFPFVFADIYRRMNNYYRITYRPPQCRGLHTATASLRVPELVASRLRASGQYDRSIFTPFTEVGEITFANIEFDYDQATIRPESQSLIREVATSMARYPTMVVEVRGHTDDRGGDEYNVELSKRRARAVADAISALGVSSTRLRVAGFGESRPVVANDSEPNRTRNRRTEFVILSR